MEMIKNTMEQTYTFYETIGLLNQICYYDENIYRFWNMLDFADNLVPPVSLGQCLIWFDEEDEPVAFITWALMDKKTEDYFFKHDHMPDDIKAWNSGSHLWLTDFVAPFGGVSKLVREVCQSIFINYPYGHSVRRGKNNEIIRYGKFFNPYYKKA